MFAPDTRIYATVVLSDRSLQYSLTVGVNILAIPVNLLSFYLILTQSKRERSSFKVCLFLSQLFFFIAQFHLGVLTGLVTLHPFPGFCSVGLLSDSVSSFTLCLIWCILFCSYVYGTLSLLIVRLRIVARPGKMFDCNTFTSTLSYAFLAFYVYTPVPGILAMSYSSREDMEQFVRLRFPNNMMVFNNPGVYIFTNYDQSGWVQTVMMSMIVTVLIFIAFMYVAISKEIRIGMVSKSGRHANDSRKSLHNLVVQSMSYSVFLALACGLLLKAFFNDPSVDSRVSNSIAYTFFCGASIPCQIMMISRNTAYREFVLRKLRLSSQSPVVPSVTHRQSIFTKT